MQQETSMAYVKGTKPAGETLDYADGITDSADMIFGNAGGDIIFAGGGDDFLKGGGGADVLDGGDGWDVASYDDSAVGVEVNLVTQFGKGGTAQGDILSNIEGLVGSQFNDKLIGDTEDNRLEGGKGNDILKGGGGFDILDGGLGNDVLQVDTSFGQAHGGEGTDTLVLNTAEGMKVNLKTEYFGSLWQGHHPHQGDEYYRKVDGVEDVAGSEYGDLITGDDNANLLNGRGGNDELNGGLGNDALFGEIGQDLLNGGQGADKLTGGAGADTFVYASNLDSTWIAGKPADVIMDFQHGADKIDLTQMNLDVWDLYIIDGQNYSYFGLDTNENALLDIGEFAVAVKMAPGTTLNTNDFLL
jgi:Ca2+-binding RTX toxin-like protein